MNLFLVGLGGLGCPALYALINNLIEQHESKDISLTLIDFDKVEISNLNRQFLYNESDIGKFKTDVIINNLKTILEKDITSLDISVLNIKLSNENIKSVIKPYSILLDCVDGIETKLLFNDYCKLNNVDLVYAGCVGYSGITLSILSNTYCLRCIFENLDEIKEDLSCRDNGILGLVSQATGNMQASLTMELIESKKSKTNYSENEVRGYSVEENIIKKITLSPTKGCNKLGCGIVLTKKLDLRTVSCPDTFLFSKMAFEEINKGEYCLIKFNNSEDLLRVKDSLTEDGITIKSMYSSEKLSEFQFIGMK